MFKLNDSIGIDDSRNMMVVLIRDPRAIELARGLPPGILSSASMTTTGELLLSIAWCDDSIRLLNNIGVDTVAASPIISQNKTLIEGKYQPMKHQLLTAAFCVAHPRAYVLSDPRLGKTGSIVLAMDYMQRNRLMCGGFLIVTTLTTIYSVWRETIASMLPDVNIAVVHGKGRRKTLSEPADFYITNYDSCRIEEEAFVEAVTAGRIGGVVLDEMTHVGNTRSGRSKALNRIINRTGLERVIGVTGSPGNNPESVFGMCKMVNPRCLPCTTMGAWLDLTTISYGPEPFMRYTRKETPEIIHKAMQPAIRFNKADILDLPPIVTQDRACSLTKEQERIRKALRDDAVALVESGEVITAANGGVLYQKIMQTMLGYCIAETGEPVELPHEPRLRTILEVIEETERKVVIFCCYRAVIRMRVKELRAAKHTCEYIDGSVTGEARGDILARFQNSPDPRILVVHPQTVSYGVELSAADTMIFDGPPMLGGFVYAQALERLSSAKQTAKSISIIRIMASPEEQRFFHNLDKGKEIGACISQLFEAYRRAEL